ncbi:hypothetical protein [Siansivirga zeaxanthinifaciens]|uniref:Signal peptidase n=1 Tax=Siansivirga zeaxanthinifaciens CC-SAMT-1 TaxID=1454006 RepID=A0A0C5W7E5_9FLAO|nr:hypothetical protein [Siansivirga zeaxanthinifaciens]AJR03078.1 hypothetical protein AW14_04940 [Siansivirga zeaxanthinifaciens CC-SAMT-1]
MKLLNKRTLTSTLFALISLASFSQGGSVPPPPAAPPPPGLPIDGWLLFVFGIALIYGVIKKLSAKSTN